MKSTDKGVNTQNKSRYTEELKKCLKQEVTVMDVNGHVTVGVCLAINYQYLNVVVMTDDEKIIVTTRKMGNYYKLGQVLGTGKYWTLTNNERETQMADRLDLPLNIHNDYKKSIKSVNVAKGSTSELKFIYFLNHNMSEKDIDDDDIYNKNVFLDFEKALKYV